MEESFREQVECPLCHRMTAFEGRGACEDCNEPSAPAPFVLVLDDIQHRLDVFRNKYLALGYEVVTVQRYHQCVRLLKQRRWDLVHLDHDLGEFVLDADSYEDGWGATRFYTGADVVQEILQIPVGMQPKQVIVHSVNPKGGQMRDDLNRHGIITVWEPFVVR